MTDEQKTREIYPLIPKTDKTRGLDLVYFLVNGKKFYVFNWFRNLNPQKSAILKYLTSPVHISHQD